MQSGAIKAAELASGIGAIVLGAGLALIAPQTLRDFAVPLLAVGLLVHAGGMTLRYRLESRQGPPTSLEQALFRICWAGLVALLGWIAWKLTQA